MSQELALTRQPHLPGLAWSSNLQEHEKHISDSPNLPVVCYFVTAKED